MRFHPATIIMVLSLSIFFGSVFAVQAKETSNLEELVNSMEDPFTIPEELIGAPEITITAKPGWKPNPNDPVSTKVVTHSKNGDISISEQSEIIPGFMGDKSFVGSLGAELPIHTKEIIGNDDRHKVSDTTQWPHRAAVHLLMEVEGGYGSCSGALIGPHHVLTAGHCVYLNESGGWAKDIFVIPAGFGQTGAPYGMISYTDAHVYQQWINNNDDYNYDIAIIALDRPIGNATGYFGYKAEYDSYFNNRNLTISGYPGDVDNGMNMYTMSGLIFDTDTHQLYHYLDTTGGTSGSSLYEMTGTDVSSKGVNSYGVQGGFGYSAYNGAARLSSQRVSDIASWRSSDTVPEDKADLVDKYSSSRQFIPKTTATESPFSIESKMTNLGTSAASTFIVSYYASYNKSWDSNDYLIGSTTIVRVDPFVQAEAGWSGVFPSGIPSGDYHIIVKLDSDRNVDEYNEMNNTAVFDDMLTVNAISDSDHDGIDDVFDGCPDEAEDEDGIQDNDGCPEDDADHDGVLDEDDDCPEEYASNENDKDNDGCPDNGEPDNPPDGDEGVDGDEGGSVDGDKSDPEDGDNGGSGGGDGWDNDDDDDDDDDDDKDWGLDDGNGGCNSSGTSGSLLMMLAFAFLISRRRQSVTCS